MLSRVADAFGETSNLTDKFFDIVARDGRLLRPQSVCSVNALNGLRGLGYGINRQALLGRTEFWWQQPGW
jgi:hypothetical protein